MRLPLNPKRNLDHPTFLKKAAYQKGVWGERVAALYLRGKGYRVLETRFKTPFGEIDLIVQKGGWIVAVEVKTRSSLNHAMVSLGRHQQRRIERALTYYLARMPRALFLRFDVVLIAPWTWPRHIQGAWRAHSD